MPFSVGFPLRFALFVGGAICCFDFSQGRGGGPSRAPILSVLKKS